MSKIIDEIRESLTSIFKKLEAIEFQLERQGENIKVYIKQNNSDLDSNESLIAGLKSTRTSFELLRDEIDELHQLMVALKKVKE